MPNGRTRKGLRMTNQTNWLVEKIQGLEDEAFSEVAGAIAEKQSVTEAPETHDEIIHISEIQDEISDEYKNWGKVKGLKTGYSDLDDKLGGMDKGHVILIGGETSNGKSALAANIATNVAHNHGVLYITLEMLTREIGARIMHINGGRVDNLDMMFQAEHRLTYKDLKPLIIKAKEQGNVELVVLDYLQYLGRGMKPEEVAIMSKEIKTIALEFEIPLIVIVSLRKGEAGKQKRKWTEIEIEDFMGTGSIGYDADAAMLASRKNLNNEYDEEGLYVKILKTRNAKLDYNNRYIRYDWSGTKITENWADLKQSEYKEA